MVKRTKMLPHSVMYNKGDAREGSPVRVDRPASDPDTHDTTTHHVDDTDVTSLRPTSLLQSVAWRLHAGVSTAAVKLSKLYSASVHCLSAKRAKKGRRQYSVLMTGVAVARADATWVEGTTTPHETNKTEGAGPMCEDKFGDADGSIVLSQPQPLQLGEWWDSKSKRALLFFVMVTLMMSVCWVAVSTVGRSPVVQPTPRVALFVLEGLHGGVFDALMTDEIDAAYSHLRHTKRMLDMQHGRWAQCPHRFSPLCARATEVISNRSRIEQDNSNDGSASGMRATSRTIMDYAVHNYCSRCGIATILSGVRARWHGVVNDTLAGVAAYASASKTYPSLARYVVTAGKTVAVIGSSHMISSNNSDTIKNTTYTDGDDDDDSGDTNACDVLPCTRVRQHRGKDGVKRRRKDTSSSALCASPGVLDVECANSTHELLKCSQGGDEITPSSSSLSSAWPSTCNTHRRHFLAPTSTRRFSNGSEERSFTHALSSLFHVTTTRPRAAHNPNATDIAQRVHELNESLLIFHLDALAARAESAKLPECRYRADSWMYLAQCFLIDAKIGEVLEQVEQRSRLLGENWLVIGVSDHGGEEKSHTGSSDGVSAIAFFLATYTNSTTSGYAKLRQLVRPITQLDVLPTVLRWLNVSPYDDETERVMHGTNRTTANEETESRVRARAVYEGRIQGICSSGITPTEC